MIERIIDIVKELFRDSSAYEDCLDLMDAYLISLDSDDFEDVLDRILLVIRFLEEFVDE